MMRSSIRKIVQIEHIVRRRYDARVRFFWDHAEAILGDKFDEWLAALAAGEASAWETLHNNAVLNDLHEELRRLELVLAYRETYK